MGPLVTSVHAMGDVLMLFMLFHAPCVSINYHLRDTFVPARSVPKHPSSYRTDCRSSACIRAARNLAHLLTAPVTVASPRYSLEVATPGNNKPTLHQRQHVPADAAAR